MTAVQRFWDESLVNRQPAKTPTGGQFAGKKSGSKTAPEKAPAKSMPRDESVGTGGDMAYDPKTNRGPGYGMPNGDPKVKKLQEALNRLGLTDAKGRRLKVDGKLGPLTTQSIKAAQRRLGVEADGIVTPATLAKLTAAKSLPREQVGVAKRASDEPYGDVRYADPGYQADGVKRYPIDTEAHCRAAWSYINQADNAAKYSPDELSKIKGRIKAAGKRYGIVFDDESRSEYLGPQMFVRSYPLEDIRILSRAQGAEYADGRTVEAVVAVFDRDAEISDGEGHYLENIARTSFEKAINESRPQGSRQTWRTSCFYNHGMTLHGTPSDRFSVPLGSPLDIRTDIQRLLTVTRYNKTPLADEILEAIHSGDITGHSFTGRIIKSDPQRPPRRGYTRGPDGTLQRVRRLELGLKEYGPTPFPAYADTAVLGVRSMLTGLALPALLSATREQIIRELQSGGFTPDEVFRAVNDEPSDSDTSAEAEAVTDEPPDEGHSRREVLLRRIAAAKTTRPGLAWPDEES